MTRTTDRTPGDRTTRKWEPIDKWFERWDRAHDPDARYGRYGRNPADVIVKLEKAA